jgi:hypothetical protein
MRFFFLRLDALLSAFSSLSYLGAKLQYSNADTLVVFPLKF